jgi:hypothetical protein
MYHDMNMYGGGKVWGGIGKFPDCYCCDSIAGRWWEGRPRSHFSKPIASVCHVTLTTSPPSVSQLFRQCGIFNVSQPYRNPWPVMGMTLLLCFYNNRFLPLIRQFFLISNRFHEFRDLRKCFTFRLNQFWQNLINIRQFILAQLCNNKQFQAQKD